MHVLKPYQQSLPTMPMVHGAFNHRTQPAHIKQNNKGLTIWAMNSHTFQHLLGATKWIHNPSPLTLSKAQYPPKTKMMYTNTPSTGRDETDQPKYQRKWKRSALITRPQRFRTRPPTSQALCLWCCCYRVAAAWLSLRFRSRTGFPPQLRRAFILCVEDGQAKHNVLANTHAHTHTHAHTESREAAATPLALWHSREPIWTRETLCLRLRQQYCKTLVQWFGVVARAPQNWWNLYGISVAR